MDSRYDVWLEQSGVLHADPFSESSKSSVMSTTPEFRTAGSNIFQSFTDAVESTHRGEQEDREQEVWLSDKCGAVIRTKLSSELSAGPDGYYSAHTQSVCSHVWWYGSVLGAPCPSMCRHGRDAEKTVSGSIS